MTGGGLMAYCSELVCLMKIRCFLPGERVSYPCPSLSPILFHLPIIKSRAYCEQEAIKSGCLVQLRF